VHKEPAHQVDDQGVPSAAEVTQPPAGARRASWEIRGPQETRVAVDVRDDLTLIPDMIPGRQDVDPAIVELAAKPFGQAEPARGVFRIDHHEVEGEFAPEARHVLSDGIPARTADHVAAKQDVHDL